MDRGKVAEACESHSLHAMCSPDTAFFVSVRFNRFVQNAAANSSSMEVSTRALPPYSESKPVHDWGGNLKNDELLKSDFEGHGGLCFPPCCTRSPGAVQPARQVQETTDRVHEPAAAGAGASVQAEQVPLTTEALRSGDVPHADRNAGKLRQQPPASSLRASQISFATLIFAGRMHIIKSRPFETLSIVFYSS